MITSKSFVYLGRCGPLLDRRPRALRNKSPQKWRHRPKQRSRLDSSAYGVVFFFLECITGRILVAWENRYNKYCSGQYLSLLDFTRRFASTAFWTRGADWFTVGRPQMDEKKSGTTFPERPTAKHRRETVTAVSELLCTGRWLRSDSRSSSSSRTAGRRPHCALTGASAVSASGTSSTALILLLLSISALELRSLTL